MPSTTTRRGPPRAKVGKVVLAGTISASAIAAALLTAAQSHRAWVGPVVLAAAAVIVVVAFFLLARDVAALAIAGVTAATAIYLVLAGGVHLIKTHPAHPDGQPITSGGRTVEVYNKVTSGGTGMIEDTSPLRLFRRPFLCDEQSCVIADLSYTSGDRITGVVCQVPSSDRITNGNDNSPVDDHNPGLFTSHRWLGVRLTTGHLAYFSEVWTARADRGGMHLPRC